MIEVIAVPEKILVVDDERSIVELVSFNLRKDGFQTLAAADGMEAVRLAREEKPDLIILDVMLPVIDGFEVCRILRKEMSVPILMLTARKEEVDRVVGLELGADDYVTKPFSPRELVARVKAILRRSGKRAEQEGEEVLNAGELEVDLARRKVTVGTRVVDLTYTQFELLKHLMSNPGRVFSRESLVDRIWGYSYYGDVRTVDVHIRHLREKIEREPGSPQFIETVRGVGYRFREMM